MKRLLVLLFLFKGVVPQIYTSGATRECSTSGLLAYICVTGKEYHSTEGCRV